MTFTEPRPARQRAFHFDQAACIACRACQIACKDLHDLPVGVNWRRVTTVEFGRYPHPEVFHLTIACNHCGRPACLEACPEGALAKRVGDGVVLLERERCSGCGLCAEACPYGAMQNDPGKGTMGKCDLCVGLTDAGEAPACTSACVMGALTVGWLDEMDPTEEPRGPGLPDPALTEPALRITPHRYARRG